MASTRDRLVGNRLALAGTVLYFLEWVAIAFLPEVPTERLGDDPAAILEAYADEAGTVAFAAGWFGVVLLGRILFVAALRKAFRDSGRESGLLDFALGAMIVSVTVEVVSFSLPAAAGWLAEGGADASAIVALDATGSVAFELVFGPLGVSVLTASAAMVGSRLFARWLGWLGLVAGCLLIAGGIMGAAALGANGGFQDLGEQASSIGALAFWIWILATSVILWRRSPRRAGEPTA